MSTVATFWLPVYSLARRELVRFFRQRSRFIGALAQPLIFWVLFGQAFNASFTPGSSGLNYQAYFFPGTIVMILLFTAIFSTISIIEDRSEGFLQSVLVAPVSRLSMVLGKIMGGTALAVLQGLLFLPLAYTTGHGLSLSQWLASAALMCVIAFALTGMGFILAWRMQSTQGFHAVMSLFLLPMWLLSGALFPVAGAPAWLGLVMRLNPLTYGVAAFQMVLFPTPPEGLPSLTACVAITVAFGACMALGAAVVANRPTRGDLQ